LASYDAVIDGAVYSKFDAKLETYAIMASKRGFGFKNRSLGGFFPGKRPQKVFLDCGGQGCCCIISG
jgi:hypothetical protein